MTDFHEIVQIVLYVTDRSLTGALTRFPKNFRNARGSAPVGNAARPHLSAAQRTLHKRDPRHSVREHLPVREKPEKVVQIDRDQVAVQSYAGGLVKSFERRVA